MGSPVEFDGNSVFSRYQFCQLSTARPDHSYVLATLIGEEKIAQEKLRKGQRDFAQFGSGTENAGIRRYDYRYDQCSANRSTRNKGCGREAEAQQASKGQALTLGEDDLLESLRKQKGDPIGRGYTGQHDR